MLSNVRYERWDGTPEEREDCPNGEGVGARVRMQLELVRRQLDGYEAFGRYGDERDVWLA